MTASVSRRAAVIALSLLPLPFASRAGGAQPSAGTASGNAGFVQLPCEGAGCRPVEVRDFRVGTGRAVEPGATVVLKWTGRLADRYGWPFQRAPDDDITMLVTNDLLIPGFVQGLRGMREGGKRRILIPGELGYRNETDGPLPSDYGDRRRLFATVLNKRRFKNAGDLVIDVQLKKVRPPS